METAPGASSRSPLPLARRLEAARAGLALGPPLARGLLRVSGAKRLEFLHRMSTQDLARRAPGEAVHAAFLDGRARLVAEGMVVVRPEEALLDVDAAAAPALLEHLRRFVLRDDVRLAPAGEDARVAAVLGSRAGDLIRARAEAAPAWANPRRGAPAWDVVVAPGGWDPLRGALLDAGAVELSEEELEVLRVLAGVPRWGAELDAGRLVMEAGLTGSSVSFEKGCYLGQEIVLRGTFRGQVQRGLVQLDLPAGAGPGAALRAAGQEVGTVTSAVEAPEGRVGLGYLRRAHWAPGTALETDGGAARVRRALVVEKD